MQSYIAISVLLAPHGHSSKHPDWFVQPSVPSQPALLLAHPRKLDQLVGVLQT